MAKTAPILLLIASIVYCLPSLAEPQEQVGLLVPSDMTEPFLGDYSYLRTRDWYGVYCEKNYCDVKLTKVEVNTVKATNCEGKPVRASRLTYHPARPLFLIDRKLSEVTRLARVDRGNHPTGTNDLNLYGSITSDPNSGAKIWPIQSPTGVKYKVIFPQPYDSNSECVKKGNLPIRVFAQDKLETTWQRNICGFEALDIPQDFDIIWAGDLDSDDKLDMLVYLPQGPYILLLSSKPDIRSQFSQKFPNKPSC
jgi:hypothetical protein